MNSENPETFTISITGQLTLNKDDLRRVLAEVMPQEKVQTANSSKTQDELRLAFTLKETAEILGISYGTAFRLVQRGLLKNSGALRCKIISKREIERFLKETSESAGESHLGGGTDPTQLSALPLKRMSSSPILAALAVRTPLPSFKPGKRGLARYFGGFDGLLQLSS